MSELDIQRISESGHTVPASADALGRAADRWLAARRPGSGPTPLPSTVTFIPRPESERAAWLAERQKASRTKPQRATYYGRPYTKPTPAPAPAPAAAAHRTDAPVAPDAAPAVAARRVGTVAHRRSRPRRPARVGARSQRKARRPRRERHIQELLQPQRRSSRPVVLRPDFQNLDTVILHWLGITR